MAEEAPINVRLRGEANHSGKDARVLLLHAGRVRALLDRLAAQLGGTEPPEPSGPVPESRVVGAQIARGTEGQTT